MPPAYLKSPVAAPLRPAAPFVQGCTGKLRQTREEALRAVRRRAGLALMFRAYSGGEHAQGSAYACRSCGWWHTSHAAGYRTQKRRRERALACHAG